MTDRDLVQQALGGDANAFGRLIRRHQGAVQALAFHILGDFEDARDAAQETFVQAFVKLDRLRDPGRFGAWVRRTAVNCCRSMQRRKRSGEPLEQEFAESTVPTPEAVLVEKESLELLHQSLGGMTAQNRLVITLRYLGGLRSREIADFLDVPLTTVEGRMHRAKRELRGQHMSTVRDGLSGKQLPDGFARTVLDEAMTRAQDARSRWDREGFVESCQEAMEAASRLQDDDSQIDILSMMGDAETTWLGKPGKAVSDYELALKVARDRQSKGGREELALLKALALAHLRVADVDHARDRAAEMLEQARRLNDGINETFARAMVDLAERMPGFWKPGERGGYAVAAFPLERSADGVSFQDPIGVRNYTFGCPCWCAAFIHLLPLRRLVGPSFEVGRAWEDVVDPNLGGMGWRIETKDRLVARSTVAADAESVVTPAGRFERCVRVSTEVGPEGGGPARFHTVSRPRRICGRRSLWFAPGVGLVKLRHEDQEDNVWTVWLVAHSDASGDSLLPLDVDRWWRYRWWDDSYQNDILDDFCRVAAVDGSVTFIASSTLAKQEEKHEVVRRLQDEVRCARESDDPVGESAALQCLVGLNDAAEKQPEREWLDRLTEIYTALGDEWKAAGVFCRIADLSEPAEQEVLSRYEARVTLARRLGDHAKAAEGLRHLGFKQRETGHVGLSAGTFDEASNEASAARNPQDAVRLAGEADLSRHLAEAPRSDTVGYASGWAYIRTPEGGTRTCEITSHGSTGPYPPGSTGTPMTDLLLHGPFMGIEVLDGEEGASYTDYWNVGVGSPPGVCESMRWTSTLTTRAATVQTPQGTFDNAILVETTVETSEEDKKVGPELERLRGYRAGQRKTWFVSGIGLVRLDYAHANGLETTIQLEASAVDAPAREAFPLAAGSRWTYRWTDPSTGTEYEDFLRVVISGEAEWYLAYVTRATEATHRGESA